MLFWSPSATLSIANFSPCWLLSTLSKVLYQCQGAIQPAGWLKALKEDRPTALPSSGLICVTTLATLGTVEMPALRAAADRASLIMPLALLLLLLPPSPPPPLPPLPGGFTTICSRSDPPGTFEGWAPRVAEVTSAWAILKADGPIFFAPAIRQIAGAIAC